MVRTNPDLERRFYLKRLLQSREQLFQQGEHTDCKIGKHLKSYSKSFSFTGGRKQGEWGPPWQSSGYYLPSNAGELRSHVPWGKWACVHQLEKPPSTVTWEKPVHNNKDPPQPNKRRWGSGMNSSGVVRWWITHRFSESSLLSGRAVSWGRACGKDRILTKIWSGSILFQLISGNK